MNTRTPYCKTRRGTALCVLLWLACTAGFAHPPRSTEQRGTVEAIDPAARTLWLQRTGEAPLLTLTWNERTRFIKQDTFTTSAALRKGSSITAWYRTPLFGPRWATKIRIDGGAGVIARNPASPSGHAKP